MADQVIEYRKIVGCESCGWDHDGNEEKDGEEIFENRYGEKYFICHLTKEKVLVE